MSQRTTKVIVELHLKAITCPGVYLVDKDDVFLSVCIMHHYKSTSCYPAVFPLLLNEKMKFDKVFKQVHDPAEVAELLESETVTFELIQQTSPGESLASFEMDARAFLFPEPKLAPSSPGVDREVLMTRAPTFPGIAPKIEFSTRTTIIECSARSENAINPKAPLVNGTGSENKRNRPQHLPQPAFKKELLRRTSPLFQRSWPITDSRENINQTHSSSREPEEEDLQSPGANNFKATPSPKQALQGGSLSRDRSPESQHMWEDIHERVRSLLTSTRAMHRLAYGATNSEIDDVIMRRCATPYSCRM
ncbi:hypothetical protein GJAV_G00161750 [Gymnothorax javanicus]|nr:hypothetical protein GJAV_G00161750 [Gymnothorax javanicus]